MKPSLLPLGPVLVCRNTTAVVGNTADWVVPAMYGFLLPSSPTPLAASKRVAFIRVENSNLLAVGFNTERRTSLGCCVVSLHALRAFDVVGKTLLPVAPAR